MAEKPGDRLMGTVILKLKRGAPDEAARHEIHAVPFESGQSVLDALRWVRAHRDPSLAIRYSCTSANTCKECMLRVDGKTVYACTARLEAREMLVEPLPNKTLIRDLVTEIAPPDERLIFAFPPKDIPMNPPVVTPSDAPLSEADLARILALNGLALSPEHVRAIAPGVVIVQAMLARVNAPLPREAEPALTFNVEQR